MDDDNNNNNNNNSDDDEEEEEEADPDFQYHPDYSTTCIFFHNLTTGYNSMLRWSTHPYRHFLPFYPPSTTIFSSSVGVLLCHKHSPSTSISTYYVGNPFHEVPYLSLRAPRPHPSDTHAVISAGYDGIFLIICLVPNPTQAGNIYYTIDAYSFLRRSWLPALSNCTHLDNDVNRVVITNSGISCGRRAYWLTWLPASRSSVLVVRVDAKSFIDPVKYPLLTYLKIPASIPDDGVGIRMQLGRVGKCVGLVVVDEIKSTVELYIMSEIGRINGNQGDDDAVMIGWVPYPSFLMVDVDPMGDEEAVEVVGLNRIKCREMPRPMRFESFKMEVLLSVGGGRQVVVWENSSSDFARSQVLVVGGMVSGRGVPFLARCAVPHISTSVVPSDSSSVPPA